MLASLTVAVAACYDYTLPAGADAKTSPEMEQTPTDRDAADGSISSSGGILGDASAEAAALRCPAGRFSCGGNVLAGPPDTLFRCKGDGTGTLTAKCANGCIVRAPGKDDECNAPTPCTVGGAYCGGDKINGEPDVLYRCLDGGATSVLQRCKNRCSINPGLDDSCK